MRFEHRTNEGGEIPFEVGKVVDVALSAVSQGPIRAALPAPVHRRTRDLKVLFDKFSPSPKECDAASRELDDAQRTVRNRTLSAARISSSMPPGGTGLSSVDVRAIDAFVPEGVQDMKEADSRVRNRENLAIRVPVGFTAQRIDYYFRRLAPNSPRIGTAN